MSMMRGSSLFQKIKIEAPFTRYNLLSNQLSNPFDNRFDKRLYRVYSRLSNPLYRVNWV